MKASFRDVRLAFAIGLAMLSGCLFIAWSLSEAAGGPFGRVLQESFVIG
jgi:HAMP domain-containing protein